MKLRNGKYTKKNRLNIKEEFNTNHFFYIDKEQNKKYFKFSMSYYKINRINKEKLEKTQKRN